MALHVNYAGEPGLEPGLSDKDSEQSFLGEQGA